MLNSVLGVVRNGKIELSEAAPLEEGARLLVTFLPLADEQEFWLQASQPSLAEIWDNPADDAYAQLLQT
ncbi:MAG TPA: hypothetical protein VFV87_00895 [Pirellulaceae bacterium]|nr:hypothetical protein [Pirellulaceae bacterium]